MTDTLKGGGGTVTYEFKKDEKSGLLLPTGREHYDTTLGHNLGKSQLNNGLITDKEEIMKSYFNLVKGQR